MGRKFYVIPKDYNQMIVGYVEKSLREAGVTVDPSSDKILEISFRDLIYLERWGTGSRITLMVNIPETGYSQVYTKEDWSGIFWTAGAYAVHLTTMEMLADPKVKNYILCK